MKQWNMSNQINNKGCFILAMCDAKRVGEAMAGVDYVVHALLTKLYPAESTL